MFDVLWIIESIIVLPALGYIFWGRPYRRRMILCYFTPSTIADYFDQFWAGSKYYATLSATYRSENEADRANGATDEIEKKLTHALFDLYNRRFGWRSYLVPLAVLATVLYVEATQVTNFIQYWLIQNASTTTGVAAATDVIKAFDQLPDKVVVAALAGAYLWVGLDLFARASSLSLLPSDINYYALRMAVAPIMGFALSTAAGKADMTVLVAFTVTLLPVADFLTWVRSISAKTLGVADAPQEVGDKLISLPGIDSDLAARLQTQGITTILQLCEADPVQLSMRTGLEFAFIVRLVDEALAWVYFGNKFSALKTFGWAGASDIIDAAPAASETPDSEKAALDYATAKNNCKRADVKLASVPDSNPNYPQLKDAKAKADQALADAKISLVSAITAPFNNKLIADIAAVQDLKLVESGLRNIVRHLNDDKYAQFIRSLLRDIQVQPAQAATQLRAGTGMRATVGKVANWLKDLTLKIGGT